MHWHKDSKSHRGDVLIDHFERDKRTQNSYTYENTFEYSDVPRNWSAARCWIVSAATPKGTFLQNGERRHPFHRGR